MSISGHECMQLKAVFYSNAVTDHATSIAVSRSWNGISPKLHEQQACS